MNGELKQYMDWLVEEKKKSPQYRMYIEELKRYERGSHICVCGTIVPIDTYCTYCGKLYVDHRSKGLKEYYANKKISTATLAKSEQ